MALSYRSPTKEVLASLTTTEQSAIAAPAVASIRALEEKEHNLFSYAMSPAQEQKLITAGIYLSPFSHRPHSHPVCKTLENYSLYHVVEPLLDHTFFFVGIKQSKVNFLKSRNSKVGLCEIINRYVVSKDKVRYGSDFVNVCTDSETACADGSKVELSANLLGLKAHHTKMKGRRIFMHDELHYWSKESIKIFLKEAQPEMMICTIVVPPELLIGAKSSMNLWCYDFEIVGENFRFYPDGVRSEGYEQPMESVELLKLREIKVSDDLTYSVDLISSKFSHHVLCLTRGRLITDRARSFSGFDAICSKEVAPLCNDASTCFPIAYSSMCKIYTYLCTLNTPDVKSAVAKLRQIVNEPTAFEVKFTMEFAELLIKNGLDKSIIMPDNFRGIKKTVTSLMPGLLVRNFKSLVKNSLTEFVSSLAPLSFSVETQVWDLRDGSTLGELTNEVVDLCESVLGKVGNWLNRERMAHSGSEIYEGFYDRLENLEGILVPLLEILVRDGVINLNVAAEETQLEVSRLIVEPFRSLLEVAPPRFFDDCLIKAFRELKIKEQGKDKSTPLLMYEGVSAGSELAFSPAHLDDDVDTREPEPNLEVDHGLGGVKRVVHEDCGIELYIVDALFAESLKLPLPDNLRGRKAGFYSRANVEYAYNGGFHKPQGWVSELDAFLMINGYPKASFDCVLIQEYKEGASIGFHADNEEIFEVGAPILTVNIQGTAWFGVSCHAGRTNFHFEGPELFLMPSGYQESHKHSVWGCSEGRMSATFRKLRTELLVLSDDEEEGELLNQEGFAGSDDLEASQTVASESCSGENDVIFRIGNTSVNYHGACDVTGFRKVEVSGKDNMCLWNSLSYFLDLDPTVIKKGLEVGKVGTDGCGTVGDAHRNGAADGAMAELEDICLAAERFALKITVHIPKENQTLEIFPPEIKGAANLLLASEHFSPLLYANDCVVVALGELLMRKPSVIYYALEEAVDSTAFEVLKEGKGLDLDNIEEVCSILNVRCNLEMNGERMVLNEKGAITGFFVLEGDHFYKIPEPKNSHLNANEAWRPSDLGSEKGRSSKLSRILLAGNRLIYNAELKRATRLERSLLDGTSGIISTRLFDGRKEKVASVGTAEQIQREVIAFLGTFGSGKTTLFKKMLKRRPPGVSFHFVSPRKSLLSAVKAELVEQRGGESKSKGGKVEVAPLSGCKFSTFETFLLDIKKKKGEGVVFLDEVQLYPPGYLDMVCYLMSDKQKIVLLGDPCQSDYDSERDRHVFFGVEADVLKLLQGQFYNYNVKSQRFKNPFFVGRLPCDFGELWGQSKGSFYYYTGFEEVLVAPKELRNVLLVSSFVEKKMVRSYLGMEPEVLTFGESTGRTFEKGLILITGASFKVGERRWLTALSRFSNEIGFINLSEVPLELLAAQWGEKTLGKFLTQGAELSDLKALLPGEPVFVESYEKKAGRNFGVREEKLKGDPWLKCEIFLGQEPDMQIVDIVEALPKEGYFKTHIPICSLETMRSRWVHKILAKEFREYKFRDLVTNQFSEEHSKQRGKRLTNQAERFESIYPRHRGDDTLTFLMAVKKRLSFSNPQLEMAKLREARPYGKFLLGEFLKHVPLRREHRRDFMEQALSDFEDKKVSKSSATIENHSGRSLRDWYADFGLIFSKSQLCTKWEKRFCPAKAAQTIVCFQHAVLCRFAPYMRYIEKKLFEVLPERFYIHSGKGLDELNDWVIRRGFNTVCTESDYEAFDASQDHFIMAFEIAVMEHLGIPRDVVADYVYIKTHLGCKLGNLAIMRFSGEASTFLFNTMANMLFTFLRYDLNGKESMCFAGDDMCAASALKVKGEHEDFLGKLKLKAKVQRTRKPTFCGWNLTHFGIYKKPQLVMERICVAKETNNLQNCIDNYAIEVSYAYRKGELAANHMDEEELEAHYNCVRVIVKNKHLLKSEVVNLFRNLD